MAGRNNMLARTPGGEGELIRAHELLKRQPTGRTIRLNPGGGEYDAVFMDARDQGLPRGWIRIKHQRPGLAKPTINVVPPSVEVRILD